MGLADGPTEVHKVTVARQVLRDHQAERRPVADRAPARSGWPRRRAKFAEHLEHEVGNLMIDVERAHRVDGRPGPLGRRARRSSWPSSPAAPRTRSTRSAAATSTPRCASRPPSAPDDADDGILREWRIIEALDGTDVPHTAGHRRRATTQSVLGRTFYLMGFVDGWSPMEHRRARGPAPFDTDLEARQGLAYQLVEGIALLSKVDWQAKGLEDLGRPDGFHERQVDRWTAFLERIKGRELPGFDEAVGLAAGPQADRLRPRPHARRLPVRQRHVPSTARRPGWPPSSTGRWAPSATRSSTSAGSCTRWPEDTTTATATASATST